MAKLFRDKNQPEHNNQIPTYLLGSAQETWILLEENIKDIEISAYSNGYDVSSEMAIHHAKVEHDYDMRWWKEGYDDPLEPFDYNLQAKKCCTTCFKLFKPYKAWQSHHTGQILACPSIPIEYKRDLVERYKREETEGEWSDADA